MNEEFFRREVLLIENCHLSAQSFTISIFLSGKPTLDSITSTRLASPDKKDDSSFLRSLLFQTCWTVLLKPKQGLGHRMRRPWN
jgi:hypothetical protein